MSRTPTHVLLMPEDFDGVPPVDHPVYAAVVSTTASHATVGLLSEPHSTAQVTLSVARARRVDEHEFRNGAPGEWLRKAVVGVHNGQYVYGQVVGYDGATVTISTASGLAESLVDALEEVAPVVCFLLAHSEFDSDSITSDELHDHHMNILDRLLGDHDQRPQRPRAPTQRSGTTRSIARLLAGILPTRLHPSPDDARQWVQSDTGVETTVSCRHVVDFAYFVDGGRRIPPSLQSSLGSRFDDDPNGASARDELSATPQPEGSLDHQPRRPSHQPTSSAIPSQDPLKQLDALLDAVGSTPNHPTDSAVSVPSDATMHTQVIEAIADKPELVRFYLSVCHAAETTSKRSRDSATDEQPPIHRRRLEAASDLLDLSDRQERRQKHEFQPTKIQKAIQQTLAAPDYKGKEPMDIVEAMLSSRATKFKPIPAIIIRIFAFEFGARGLSIMHFTRFDFVAKRAWYASGACNLNNFSASISLPKPDKPTSLDDITNALTVLHVFVDEFMDHETSRLVSASREFVEELRCFSSWSAPDVETLTFWFDSMFESYRSAAEADSRHGSQTRCAVRGKLSLQDPDLQSVLYVIQSERFAALTQPHPRSNGPQRTVQFEQPRQYQRQDTQRINSLSKPRAKTPQEVLDALPRRGRLTACMKHMSRGGCVSRSDDRCAFPNHVHMLPDEGLHPVVFKHIEEHMGGVRDELRR